MIATRGLAAMLLMSVLVVATACAGCAQKSTRGMDVTQPATRRTAPPAVRHDEAVYAGGIAPPGATLHNPFTGNAKAAPVGAALFTAMNCDGCHGAGATGWVGPSLSARRWRYGGSDGDIFQSIYYGRPHGMPAFGGLLSTDEIWQIEAYIRTLPVPKDVPTESW